MCAAKATSSNFISANDVGFAGLLLQIEAMRQQQEIQAKMQLAFKMGNRAEAERLMAKLKPDV